MCTSRHTSVLGHKLAVSGTLRNGCADDPPEARKPVGGAGLSRVSGVERPWNGAATCSACEGRRVWPALLSRGGEREQADRKVASCAGLRAGQLSDRERPAAFVAGV